MRFVYDQPPTLLKILRTTKENNKNLKARLVKIKDFKEQYAQLGCA